MTSKSKWNMFTNDEMAVLFHGLDSFFIMKTEDEEKRKEVLKECGRECLRRHITHIADKNVKEVITS